MSRPAIKRSCLSCGGPISRTSASGRCRECCYGRGGYLSGARASAPATAADGLDQIPYFDAAESSAALLRALRDYAEKYHPTAQWLDVNMVDKSAKSLGETQGVGA